MLITVIYYLAINEVAEITFMECLKLQDYLKLLPVSSSPTMVDVAATPKKHRPVLSCRHTDDDLKSGDYEYITEDSKSLVLKFSLLVKFYSF